MALEEMQIFHIPLMCAVVTHSTVFPPAKVLWLVSYFSSFHEKHFCQL